MEHILTLRNAHQNQHSEDTVNSVTVQRNLGTWHLTINISGENKEENSTEVGEGQKGRDCRWDQVAINNLNETKTVQTAIYSTGKLQ